MEKFYMNDNNFNDNGQQKQSQKGKYHFSIVLSFVVAIMAIASLVVVGFDQISYAAPTDIGDSFVVKPRTSTAGIPGMTARIDASHYLYVEFDYGQVSGSNNLIPVFCIEKNVRVVSDATYTKNSNGMYTDAGLYYILNKSSVNGGSGIVSKTLKSTANWSSSDEYKYLDSYATQVAIWIYLYGENSTEWNSTKGEYNVATTETTSVTYTLDGDEYYSGTEINKKINAVVAEAKNRKSINMLTVSFSDESISQVGETEFYQTSALNISSYDNAVLSYDITDISGVSDAYVVDQDGNKVSDPKNLVPSSKVYIRFKKTSDAKNLIVSIKGHFNNRIFEYTSSGSQKIIAFAPGDYDTGAPLDLVGSPDTGMSTSQTIYFVGLIVLLCGVGIIYASAKPAKDI